MTHIALLFKLLLISVTLSMKTSTTMVTTECLENCDINPHPTVGTPGYINGGEGNNITLNFTINATDATIFRMAYDTTPNSIILLGPIGTTGLRIVQPNDPLFDFSDTKLMTGIDYSFSLKLLSLNRSVHAEKQFHLFTTKKSDFTVEELKLTINVKYGPEIIEQWMSSYTINEGEKIKLNLTLNGNPRPEVNATLGGTRLDDIIITNQPNFITQYTLTSQNVGKTHCGKNLTLEAVGYGSIERTAKINVIFTPDIPQISAKFNLSKCLIVRWNNIESGVCDVSYTLQYQYRNDTQTNTTISHPATTGSLQYDKCFNFNTSHYNGTVSIKATVGGRSSNFSTPIVVVVVETSSTQSTTTTTATTTVTFVNPGTGASTGSQTTDFEWYYILIIVIAAVVLIVFIICIILVVTGRIACYSCTCCKKESRTKPAVPESGYDNQQYDMTSVDGLQRCMTVTKNDDDNATGKESEYAECMNMEKPKYQQTDYAELGPGGRTGERPKVQPSFYAQVNTDQAYYPPLNPETRVPPTYAVASKPGTSPTEPPVYAQSTKMRTIPPPSDYEDDSITV